jgi:hypothetical protein
VRLALGRPREPFRASLLRGLVMTTRRFPPPLTAEQIPGGYVMKDTTGQALAYVSGPRDPC